MRFRCHGETKKRKTTKKIRFFFFFFFFFFFILFCSFLSIFFRFSAHSECEPRIGRRVDVVCKSAATSFAYGHRRRLRSTPPGGRRGPSDSTSPSSWQSRGRRHHNRNRDIFIRPTKKRDRRSRFIRCRPRFSAEMLGILEHP